MEKRFRVTMELKDGSGFTTKHETMEAAGKWVDEILNEENGSQVAWIRFKDMNTMKTQKPEEAKNNGESNEKEGGKTTKQK